MSQRKEIKMWIKVMWFGSVVNAYKVPDDLVVLLCGKKAKPGFAWAQIADDAPYRHLKLM